MGRAPMKKIFFAAESKYFSNPILKDQNQSAANR